MIGLAQVHYSIVCSMSVDMVEHGWPLLVVQEPYHTVSVGCEVVQLYLDVSITIKAADRPPEPTTSSGDLPVKEAALVVTDHVGPDPLKVR